MLEKSMNQEPSLINQRFSCKKESPMIYQGKDVKKITPLGTAKDLFFPIIKKKKCSCCHKKTSSHRKECYFCRKVLN